MRTSIVSLVALTLLGTLAVGCRSTAEQPISSAATTNSTADDRHKATRTMSRMRTLAVCCEAYAIDYGHYPKLRSIAELAEMANGVYVRAIITKDEWGNDFVVRSSKKGYEIRSLGRDGKRDRHVEPRGMTGDLDADIVYVTDKMFVQAPLEG